MRHGQFVEEPIPWNPTNGLSLTPSGSSSLYTMALQWLKEDRDIRRELEKAGQKVTRGARRDQVMLLFISSGDRSNLFYRGSPRTPKRSTASKSSLRSLRFRTSYPLSDMTIVTSISYKAFNRNPILLIPVLYYR